MILQIKCWKWLKTRINKNGWTNVELVQIDASEYRFPQRVDGIISTFAITLIPEYDKIIYNASNALPHGKRIVILDLKMPSSWLSILTPLAIFITSPFGVNKDISDRHPWESVNKYFECSSTTDLYGGFAYLTYGEK